MNDFSTDEVLLCLPGRTFEFIKRVGSPLDVTKARGPWTAEEDSMVLDERASRVPINELASQLGRTTTAIMMRFTVLNNGLAKEN